MKIRDRLILLFNPHRVQVEEPGHRNISWALKPDTAKALLEKNSKMEITKIYWRPPHD